MVGTARFELATSRTPSVRATRLRYVPTVAATQNSRKLNNSTVSLAFEERQETAEGIAQVQQHFAVQLYRFAFSHRRRGNFFDRCFEAAAVFEVTQMAAGAGNREAFVVEEALDLQNQVHVLLAVQAIALAAFHRLQHGKFLFPIPQDKGADFGDAADFADAVIPLVVLFLGDRD